MLHLLLEQGVPVSHVVYFETEWDFPQMRAHLDLVTAKTGLRIIRVRYYRYFEEMLALWGWPKSAGGWCTASKHRTCLKYIGHIKGDKTEYIGFSADEVKRTQTKWMKERRWPVKFPLIDAGMGEADSLAYCKRLGYNWDGLYDVFDRVSCFCCPKGGKAKRRLIREHFPELEREWQRLDAVACMSNAPRQVSTRSRDNLHADVGCCASCRNWAAILVDGDTMKPTGKGICESDAGPFRHAQTHGSIWCPSYTANASLDRPAASAGTVGGVVCKEEK
jgi:3'-phosphoadenosine 5'-phosphosulfate sulfotransferase (PAPS reductase)/FAD synthetase